jgi:hypothetical protein
VVVRGIAVFESSNISRSGCASTAITTETMTTERSWPKASQCAGYRARRLRRGRVDSEEDMLVCDGERTGLNGLLMACIVATVMPFSEYPAVGLRSGCKFVNKNSLDND